MWNNSVTVHPRRIHYGRWVSSAEILSTTPSITTLISFVIHNYRFWENTDLSEWFSKRFESLTNSSWLQYFDARYLGPDWDIYVITLLAGVIAVLLLLRRNQRREWVINVLVCEHVFIFTSNVDNPGVSSQTRGCEFLTRGISILNPGVKLALESLRIQFSELYNSSNIRKTTFHIKIAMIMGRNFGKNVSQKSKSVENCPLWGVGPFCNRSVTPTEIPLPVGGIHPVLSRISELS